MLLSNNTCSRRTFTWINNVVGPGKKLLTKFLGLSLGLNVVAMLTKEADPWNMSYLSNSWHMMSISSCIYFHWPWKHTVSLTKSTQHSMKPATNPANWIKFPFSVLQELEWGVFILQQNMHFQSNKWPSGIFSFHALFMQMSYIFKLASLKMHHFPGHAH